MLNRLRQSDRGPMVLLVIAVAIVLVVASLTPIINEIFGGEGYANSQNYSDAYTLLDWGTITAIATATIALFAIFQYSEFRRSSERQLKAYVFVENCILSKDPNWDASPWEIHLIIKNYGATPAQNLAVILERDIRPAIAIDHELTFSGDAQRSRPGPIPPGHFFTVRAPIMTNAQYQQAQGRNDRVYIWGRVEFGDIFTEGRWLTFQLEHELDNANEFSFSGVGNRSG